MNTRFSLNSDARRKVIACALGNLCLHIVLLLIIVQCVWLARMAAITAVEAKSHIFLSVPAYDMLISFFESHPTWRLGVNPYVCPYAMYAILVLVGNGIFSFKASRVIRQEKKKCNNQSSCTSV